MFRGLRILAIVPVLDEELKIGRVLRRIPRDVTFAGEEFTDMAPVLEQHLESHEFVAGDRVTAADFVVAYTLDWANEAKLLGNFPASTAYMERMYGRPRAALRIREAFKQIQT